MDNIISWSVLILKLLLPAASEIYLYLAESSPQAIFVAHIYTYLQ
jgi:hypothetical protein